MPDPAGPSAVAWTAAASLRVDHATAEVLVAFRAAGVQALLLKGPSISRWLYRDGEVRPYRDSDLLVRPSDMTAAGRALAGIGYVPELDERAMPAWWRPHASAWLNAERRAFVDVHRTLQGVGVDDELAWALLSRGTETLIVAGVDAAVLSLPARTLYVALTAANDGPSGQAGADLEHALAQLPETTWRAAAVLAGELGATDWLFAGLSQLSEGEALSRRLGLDGRRSVEISLRNAGAPREALTVDRVARGRGPRERTEIVVFKLFPPPAYMRFWSRVARRGRGGLAVAYGYRLLWVAKKAIPALVAWRRARRR
jgi:putative nucleotidyltransferase-like protein